MGRRTTGMAGIIGSVLLAACQQSAQQTAGTPASATATSPVANTFSEAHWKAPLEADIPKDSLGASIRRGLYLMRFTPESLPAYATSSLHCTSCHQQDGLKPSAAPLTGAHARFPKYLPRSASVIPLSDRVNYCFTRSLAGNAIPVNSREMQDILAYIAFISKGVPVGTKIAGTDGLISMTDTLVGDRARGEVVFKRECVLCHQADGQGTTAFPAIWGPKSFSIGASMAREERAASFIWHNMPQSKPGSLTPQEAFDVAAFVNSHPRPDSPGKEGDWPAGGAPADVPYATKGHAPHRPPGTLVPRAKVASALVPPPAPIARTTPGVEPMLTRRDLIVSGAAAAGGAILSRLSGGASTQAIPAAATPPTQAPSSPIVPVDATKIPGSPTRAVGARSPFETPSRTPTGEITGNSLTPLEKLTGQITPADLHFERHHAGVPAIDPTRHTLLLHGLVDRPTEFTVDDIRSLPQVTRVHFIECSGNGRGAYRDPKPDLTAQNVAGLTSNTEWTGVPLATLFREVGVQRDSRWFLAEGGDACLMTRSLPIEKGLDDALIVWAQNGEPLRPEQGFPLRLLLPGWEGNTSVKWIRRIELGTRPWMTRWETSKYTDPLPNGTARQFSFEQDAKSIITSPSHPDVLTRHGWRPITGLAWSGRGCITNVDVSTDGGQSWHRADLLTDSQPKAHVRFQYMWKWNGNESVLVSRATDETGYVQPTRAQLINVRGIGTDFHFNPIVGWRVQADGHTYFHGET